MGSGIRGGGEEGDGLEEMGCEEVGVLGGGFGWGGRGRQEKAVVRNGGGRGEGAGVGWGEREGRGWSGREGCGWGNGGGGTEGEFGGFSLRSGLADYATNDAQLASIRASMRWGAGDFGREPGTWAGDGDWDGYALKLDGNRRVGWGPPPFFWGGGDPPVGVSG